MYQPTSDQALVLDAIAGDLRRVRRRLARGASPRCWHPIHGSALIQAVRRQDAAMTALLIAHGADAHAECPTTGRSAIDHALEPYGDARIADLCAGADPAPLMNGDPESAELPWPASFLACFAIHCDIDCCAWDACDLGAAGISHATASTGLDHDELAWLAREVLATPPAELMGCPRLAAGLVRYLPTLLHTLQRLREGAETATP
jgi:hypothetical protein